MKKCILGALFTVLMSISVSQVTAQIDLDNLDLKDLFGKIMNVTHGYAPKFALGNITLPKLTKVGEILGLKRNPDILRYFNTFKTGRSIYKITSYAGGAIAVYGLVKKASDSASSTSYKTALVTGITAVVSGVLVKLITKAAAYKAVDLFNGIAVRKIRDLIGIKPASSTMGLGLYVKL